MGFDIAEGQQKSTGHAGYGDWVSELNVEGCSCGRDVVGDDVRVGCDEGGDDEGARVKYCIGSDCFSVSLSNLPFANPCSPEHCHVLLHLPGDYWCSDTRRRNRSHE